MIKISKPTIQQKWKELADKKRLEVQLTPPGRARDALLKEVRQLEVASNLEKWISSPGLKPLNDPEQSTAA